MAGTEARSPRKRSAEAPQKPTLYRGVMAGPDALPLEVGPQTGIMARTSTPDIRKMGPFTRLVLAGQRKAAESHADMLALQDNSGIDLTQKQELGSVTEVGNQEPQIIQMDLPRLRKAYKLVLMPEFIAHPDPDGDFTMPTPAEYLGEHARFKGIFDSYVDSHKTIKDVRTVEDLVATLRNPRTVALMKSIEGLYVNEATYENTIDTLMADGVVSYGIKWNFDDIDEDPEKNGIGTTTKAGVRNAPGAVDSGLTPLGYKVIERIDQKGGIIDVAHGSDQLIWDVLSIPSDKPRIDSHAGSREVVPQNRNITDDHARLIINGGTFVKEGNNYRILDDAEASTYVGEKHTVTGGGIVGMPFVALFAGANEDGISTVEQVVDHMQHFKDLGLLHGIVLGSDFDGVENGQEVQGVHNAEVFRKNLRKAMRARGFTRKEIRQVFYENKINFWLKNLPSERDLPQPGQEATVFQAA